MENLLLNFFLLFGVEYANHRTTDISVTGMFGTCFVLMATESKKLFMVTSHHYVIKITYQSFQVVVNELFGRHQNENGSNEN